MSRRVIQFSTGNVGRQALRAIIERPDLELVGVHASGPDKIGRDAADLCGLTEPTGITATDSIDELVDLGADCVVYTSQGETRVGEAVAEICQFLSAGVNVVGTSLVFLVAPAYADDQIRIPLETACCEGNTSLYVNGIDPGFSGDTLPYSALSLTSEATSVTVQEIFDYGTYDDAEFTGVAMGFGAEPDTVPMMFIPGVITSIWGGQVKSLADQIGITLDQVRERHESWVTSHEINCTMMSVAPGRVAAVRFAVEGMRAGRPVITMEHINRLTPAAAPHWPYPPDGRSGVHRVVVEGNPGVEMNTHVGLAGIDHNEGGVVSTAVRVTNAIEAVCRAPAGLVAARDLQPADLAYGTMR